MIRHTRLTCSVENAGVDWTNVWTLICSLPSDVMSVASVEGIMLLRSAVRQGGASFTVLVGTVAGKNFASRLKRRIKRPAFDYKMEASHRIA